ncbi:T9SS type A sorting domain-containing protein [Lewinella sp. IMCC34183]|uniref:T9SS type A sorting domain-containing protein n=1 Tax=Lewinella sp. IMCC34183 TaxID=2248762 RepID=UPI000E23A894|nr:T9SS type A sorting domain-containing protein [Lewinella sp. IMCC34183]
MKYPYLFFLLLPGVAFAQSTFVLPVSDVSYRADMVMTPAGDRVLFGEVFLADTTSVDLDPGPGVTRLAYPKKKAGYAAYLASYAPDGKRNFSFLIGDAERSDAFVQAYYVDTDAEGNIYVQGTFHGSADFDPSAAVYRLSSPDPDTDRTFVASYTAAGELRFALDLPYYAAPKYELVDYRLFATDGAGNSYLVVYNTPDHDYDPGPGELRPDGNSAIILSYDRDGNYRFGFRTIRSPYVLGASSSGDFYVLGTFQPQDEGRDLDPTEGKEYYVDGTADSTRCLLIAYASDQTVNFAHAFPGVHPYPDFIDGDAAGNVYLTGSIFATTEVAPGPETHYLEVPVDYGDPDLFLAKYSRKGTLLRAVLLEDRDPADAFEYFYDHRLLDDGTLYLSGFLGGKNVDFDPSPTAETVLSGNDDYRYRTFVAGYDADLNLNFAHALAGTEGEENSRYRPAMHLAAGGRGDCRGYGLLGTVRLPLAGGFGPVPGAEQPVVHNPGKDSLGLLLTLTTDPGCGAVTRVRENLPVTAAPRIAPNPSATGHFRVYLETAAPVPYRVTDVSGRAVATGTLTPAADGVMTVDLGRVPPGIYAAEFLLEGAPATARLVVR